MWKRELQALDVAARSFQLDRAAQVVARMAEQVLTGGTQMSDDEQKQAFDSLRAARWFDLIQNLATVLLTTRQTSHRTRRQHAQALIEQQLFDDALDILTALNADESCPISERMEAGGLIGRVYKQLYVDRSAVLGPAKLWTLKQSISAYYGVYTKDRAEYTWQGINAVAMLLRGRRDGLSVEVDRGPDVIATEILSIVRASSKHWDMATAAEACLALDLGSEAATHIERYVRHAELDAFSCASTLRQLKEVWQIKEGGPGGELLTLLQPAVLHGSVDANRPVVQRIGSSLKLAAGELRVATDCASEHSARLERVFGNIGPRSFEWYKTGIARAGAVARVETPYGKGFGTGFLVRGSDLFKALAGSDELLLVTNSHVLGQLDMLSLRPSDAVLRWDAVDSSRRAGVKEILFESPPTELDVTIARLDAAVTGVQACPLSAPNPPTFEEGRARQLYVIGYPDGGSLTLSIDDNLQVGWSAPRLHYRTPTRTGSSGSPVFDDNWQVIGVHRAGSDNMPRLDGKPGTYQANEGVWIHAVLEAIAKLEQRGLQHEAASPAVRPAFRKGIFVSYAHADASWLEIVMTHLKPLLRSSGISTWDDRKLEAGSDWSAEIERQLDQASVAILLVSPSFLASDFIAAKEFPRLLSASHTRGLTIVPVAVRHSNFEYVPELAALQFANEPETPLSQLSEAQRDAALTKVVQQVASALKLARISNGFRAADAMAYKEAGLGGETLAAGGLASMSTKVIQTIDAVVLETPNGTHAIADLNSVAILNEHDRQLIDSYDATITDLMDRWTELYPKRAARDQAQRTRARSELLQVRIDLCRELNGMLRFYESFGAPLSDHYRSVRHICDNNFEF